MRQLNQKIYGTTNRLQLVLSYSEMGQYDKALAACSEAEASLNAIRQELLENAPRDIGQVQMNSKGGESHA